MKIVALIPAHNEAASISDTVRSLQQQTVPPDKIVVACDNCTDDTYARALAAGAEPFETVGNTAKKAGALNQGFARVVSQMDPAFVLVADADTELAPTFIQTALDRLGANPTLGAVGGIFTARSPQNLIERFQANEYHRYSLELERKGRVMVLSGTASVIRWSALRQVAQARGGALPGRAGEFYDSRALTEDNEMTLALKTLGWNLVSPDECRVITEVMPSIPMLWKQRLRWYRGAIDNLTTYGMTPVTRRYWGQQALLLLGVAAMSLYLLLAAVTIVLGELGFNPFWLMVGLIFWTDRFVTAPRDGRKAAAWFVPELLYEIGLQWVFMASLTHAIRGKETGWHHLNTQETACTSPQV